MVFIAFIMNKLAFVGGDATIYIPEKIQGNSPYIFQVVVSIEIINNTIEEASRLKIVHAANGGQIQVPDIKSCSDWLI
jgi:hypothetical protein